MKSIICLALVYSFNLSYGQYYYNDLLTAKQTNEKYVLLKTNHIREVIAKSFEADGAPTEDFLLNQEISQSGNQVTTTTNYPSAGMSVSVATYNNNHIVKSTDSSGNMVKTTTYSYDGDQLVAVATDVRDVFLNNSGSELHQYIYEHNVPVKMLLIKNAADTTTIVFIADSLHNIGEERWIRQGKTVEQYFYYYNSRNQLTDIVRFNLKANRLLPDFLFDYDEKGILKKMTQVPQGSDDYLVWVYQYLPDGLKDKELCYNKQRQPVGRIEYQYK